MNYVFDIFLGDAIDENDLASLCSILLYKNEKAAMNIITLSPEQNDYVYGTLCNFWRSLYDKFPKRINMYNKHSMIEHSPDEYKIGVNLTFKNIRHIPQGNYIYWIDHEFRTGGTEHTTQLKFIPKQLYDENGERISGLMSLLPFDGGLSIIDDYRKCHIVFCAFRSILDSCAIEHVDMFRDIFNVEDDVDRHLKLEQVSDRQHVIREKLILDDFWYKHVPKNRMNEVNTELDDGYFRSALQSIINSIHHSDALQAIYAVNAYHKHLDYLHNHTDEEVYSIEYEDHYDTDGHLVLNDGYDFQSYVNKYIGTLDLHPDASTAINILWVSLGFNYIDIPIERLPKVARRFQLIYFKVLRMMMKHFEENKSFDITKTVYSTFEEIGACFLKWCEWEKCQLHDQSDFDALSIFTLYKGATDHSGNLIPNFTFETLRRIQEAINNGTFTPEVKVLRGRGRPTLDNVCDEIHHLDYIY